MSADAPNKITDWRQLQGAFDALILALHTKHTHAIKCAGCNQCQTIARNERRARDAYESMLQEVIG